MSEFIHYSGKGAVKLEDVSAVYKSNRGGTYRIIFELLGRKTVWWEFGEVDASKAERNCVFDALMNMFSTPLLIERNGMEWGEME